MFESHPAVASQQNGVLHNPMWHDARTYGDGGNAVVQELDAESDGNRSEERSGFTKTAPGTRGSVFVHRCPMQRCCASCRPKIQRR